MKNLLNASILVGEIELIKEAIKRGGHIDDYALHLVVHKGNLEIVKCLIENEEYIDEFLLLKQAIEYGHLEIVKYMVELLNNSQTVNQNFFRNLGLYQYNDVSLIRAELKGHEEVVNYFIERGARIDEDGRQSVIFIDFTGV